MDRLKDKAAVVTGADSGIGRASSTLFARHGAKIIVADIDKGKGEIVTEFIRSQVGDALAVEVDVGDSASVQVMVEQAENHFGGIDLLFTNALNAGLVNNSDACALELEESVFDEIHRVALQVVSLCAKYVGAAMERRGGGAMLFTAIVDAQIGYPVDAGYLAFKSHSIDIMEVVRTNTPADQLRESP